MDGNLYEQVYQLINTIEHPDPVGVTHSVRTIVLFLYHASADNLSLLQACQPGHWVGLTPPDTRPSQPTLSRRSRMASVQELLRRMEERLRNLDPLPARFGPPRGDGVAQATRRQGPTDLPDPSNHDFGRNEAPILA